MKRYRLEFWADSFHEGNWACEELSKYFNNTSVSYKNNFIPIYTYEFDSGDELEITVFGSYRNWSPLPPVIDYLINWGKPDLLVFDPSTKKIIFAMEETAAVPTGNQALQRCERMYGSLKSNIPFWYLIGEFGSHVDGGIRRDSIWPSILAIKLSCIHHTPCIVLHYSDREHPEDYLYGDGVKFLFKTLALEIEIHVGVINARELLPILKDQYQHMLTFIESQWPRIVKFIPQVQLLGDPDSSVILSKVATSSYQLDKDFEELFDWPITKTIPKDIYDNLKPGGVIKNDSFINLLEELVGRKIAYNLSSNAGSRPQKGTDVTAWVNQQKELFKLNTIDNVEFTLDLEDCPRSTTGLYHITTAKNVFYLADSNKDVEKALSEAYPRLVNIDLGQDTPIFIYISNSMKPGRIFGDPFTGQLSAFSNIFTKDLLGNKTRLSIAYYPHQVHTQMFNSEMGFKNNKGIVMMRDLLDFAVFHGGVLVNLKTGEVS